MENMHWDENEPLAEGLDVLPEGSFRFPRPSEDLRRSVFGRTRQIVRARSRRRRFIIVAVAAAAYIGGITTALFFSETAMRDGEGRNAVVESPFGDEGTQPRFRDFITEAGELERRSDSAPPKERTRLLTRAGDLYLSAQYDVEKALNCYRRALNTMPASRQTIIEPDDSWLLAALKDSRR